MMVVTEQAERFREKIQIFFQQPLMVFSFLFKTKLLSA